MDVLEILCEHLDIPLYTSKYAQLRSLHRHLAVKEGLLPARPYAGDSPTPQELFPFLDWYPLYQSRRIEKDLYTDFRDSMTDIFGEELVHDQIPVAHGTSLKIDFHIGTTVPGHHGIGIEFKMPSTNSDVHRAVGQLDQYQARYGQALIVMVFGDLEQKHLQPFFHALGNRGIAHIVKRVFWDLDHS